MSKKQIGTACAITASTLVVLISTILVTILHGGDAMLASDMPMLAVAKSVGGVFGIIYAVVLWLAIFTTICVAAYSIVQWLNSYIKNKFVCSVITLTLAFIFSRFGFSTIVDIFYPLEGIFGAIFIGYSVVYYYKNKSRFLAKELLQLNSQKSAQSDEFAEQNESNILNDKSKNNVANNSKKYVKNADKFDKNSTKIAKHDILSTKVLKACKNNAKHNIFNKRVLKTQKTSAKCQKNLKNIQKQNYLQIVSINVQKLPSGIKKTKKYNNGKTIVGKDK